MTNRTISKPGVLTVILTDDRQPNSGGVTGYCTWETLSSQLLTPSEVASGKRVVEVTVDVNGIRFVIE